MAKKSMPASTKPGTKFLPKKVDEKPKDVKPHKKPKKGGY